MRRARGDESDIAKLIRWRYVEHAAILPSQQRHIQGDALAL